MNFLSYQASTNQNAAGTTTHNDLFARLTSDGHFFFLVDDVQIDADFGVDFNELRDGLVHSVSFTFDNTNGAYTIYVDGQLVSEGDGFATGQTLNGGPGVGELVFGQEQDAIGGGFDPTQIFSGTLHDVRVFNDVRTAAEVESNYQHALDVSPTEAAAIGLLANYQFEFDTNGQVVDTVSGNNLTVGQATGAGFTPSTPIGGLNILANAATGDVVGNVIPSDPDVSNTGPSDFTFALVDPSNNFEIDSATGQITVAATSTLDSDTAASHDIDVTVTDDTGLSHTETLTIQVGGIPNSPPTNLTSGIELNTAGGNGAFFQADDGGAILGGLGELTLEITFETQSFQNQHLISYLGGNLSLIHI